MLVFRRGLAPSIRRLRWSSTQTPTELSKGEQHIVSKLQEKLNPVEVRVQDISGGCGTFYAISIASPAFQGLSVVKQHRLVTDALKQEIGSIHGLQIKTIPTP